MFGVHPRKAEVGDLVMQIAVFGGTSAKYVIVAQGIFLDDGLRFAQFDLLGQYGIGFQGKRVGREVGKTQFEEKVEVAVPLLGIGGGQAIDEVDADVAEAGLFGPVEALPGMVGVVATAQVLKVVVEETLDADAKAVDTEVSQAFKVFWRQRVGVGLKGDFGIGCDRVVVVDAVQQVIDFRHAE